MLKIKVSKQMLHRQSILLEENHLAHGNMLT